MFRSPSKGSFGNVLGRRGQAGGILSPTRDLHSQAAGVLSPKSAASWARFVLAQEKADESYSSQLHIWSAIDASEASGTFVCLFFLNFFDCIVLPVRRGCSTTLPFNLFTIAILCATSGVIFLGVQVEYD